MTPSVHLSSARAAPCKGYQSSVCVRVVQRQEDADSEGGLHQEWGKGEEYGILSRSSRPRFFLSMLCSSPRSPPCFIPHIQKASCEKDARYALGYDKVKDISKVVTPRFLCTGGVDPYTDPNTCKGDSGGPLIIHKKSRFIQVSFPSPIYGEMPSGQHGPSSRKVQCMWLERGGQSLPSYDYSMKWPGWGNVWPVC